MKLKSSCFSGLFVFISLLGLQGSLSQLNRSKSRVPLYHWLAQPRSHLSILLVWYVAHRYLSGALRVS